METLPRSVEEAVDVVLSWVSEEEKQLLRDCEFLLEYHFTLGAAIRNELGLWGQNDELLRAANIEGIRARGELTPELQAELESSPVLPLADSASSAVLEAVQGRLRQAKE